MATITAVLTMILRVRNSRIAGTIFLLIYGISIVTIIYSRAATASGGMALFCFLLAARATYAAFKLPSLRKKGTSDHQPTTTKPYDQEKWRTLLQYDKEIALAAEKLRPLGEKWVDQFAHDFLALNDKRYLRDIIRKVITDARQAADLAERAARARQDWHG